MNGRSSMYAVMHRIAEINVDSKVRAPKGVEHFSGISTEASEHFRGISTEAFEHFSGISTEASERFSESLIGKKVLWFEIYYQ